VPDEPYHAARKVDRVVDPLLSLVELHVDLLFSHFLISWKNDVAKRLGPFDVRKVSKVKNMQTQEICFVVLKSNEMGLFRK
jgi:hypothetical protein